MSALAFGMSFQLLAASAVAQTRPASGDEEVGTVEPLSVIGHTPVYAGGQVATSAQTGLLGSRPLLDTPFSVTSYTDQLIKDRQARYLSDILLSEPSVRNTATGNSFDQFAIRGFPVTNINVAVDGLYGVAPLYRVGLEAYERVEVLKGPGALLNGMAPSGAVGGAINLVPKRALERPVSTFTADYMGDSQFGVQADLGRRFGAEKREGVRFNGVYRSGDAPLDHQSDKYALGSLALDHRGERLRISANGGYQLEDVKSPIRTTTISPGLTIPAAPDATINYAPRWARSKTKDSFGQGRVEYDLAPSLVFSLAGGLHHYWAQDVRSFQNIINAAGDTTGPQLLAFTRLDNKTLEASLRGAFETGSLKHEVGVQATAFWTGSKTVSYTLGGILRSNIYRPIEPTQPNLSGFSETTPKVSDARLASVAIADVISTTDGRVQVTLGGRLQQVRSRNFNPASGARTSRYQDSAFSPAAAVLFKPTSRVSVYANYIEGLAQGPTAPLTAANAGQVFKPQASKQYEAGVKVDFGRYGATLSAFQITQPTGFTDPLTNLFAVAGRQRNRGVELNGFGVIAPGLKALGGIAFTDGELTRTVGGLNNGKTAPAAPKTQVNVGLDWDAPFAPGFGLDGRLIYTSRQFYDPANTQSIDGWTRVDLGARYTFQRSVPVTLRVNVENLLDKTFWSSTATAGGGGGGGLLRGLPRTVRASVSASF